jgi:hypothetical protein
MTNQELKSAYLHNARTFMAQAFKNYELAASNTSNTHTDGTNFFERRADEAARNAEAQFKMAGYYS